MADTQMVEMPCKSHILTAQMRGKTLCLWALVDVEEYQLPKINREIEIHGTGNPITDKPRHYIATVQYGPWVWHVFECVY